MSVTDPGRRKRGVVATVLAVILLVAAGAYVADNWVRQQVADHVASKVVQVLSLDSDQPVTVEIAGASVIAQVLTGRIDEVGVGVDDVRIGELTGGVRLQATGIPTDLANQPIDRVQVQFTVSEKSLQKIAGFMSAGVVKTVALEEKEIRLGTGFKLLGYPVSVGVGIEPFAADGQLGFTPRSVELNGTRTTADALTDQYGSIAGSLLQTRSICIARWLPGALTVDTVEVVDKNLVIVIGADREVFDDASLARLGSCPA